MKRIRSIPMHDRAIYGDFMSNVTGEITHDIVVVVESSSALL